MLTLLPITFFSVLWRVFQDLFLKQLAKLNTSNFFRLSVVPTTISSHSRSICIIWSDLRVLWHPINANENHGMLLSSCMALGIVKIFLKKYHKSILVKGFKSYRLSKPTIKKSWGILGSRLLFLLIYGRPEFESRPQQTLRAYNFEDLWPALTFSISFERFDTFLLI